MGWCRCLGDGQSGRQCRDKVESPASASTYRAITSNDVCTGRGSRHGAGAPQLHLADEVLRQGSMSTPGLRAPAAINRVGHPAPVLRQGGCRVGAVALFAGEGVVGRGVVGVHVGESAVHGPPPLA